MDTTRIHGHDDTIDAHFACLGRLEAPYSLVAPHGCMNGLVFIGYLVEDPETGEEVESFEAVACRHCSGKGSVLRFAAWDTGRVQ
jgi:hypothetical protein